MEEVCDFCGKEKEIGFKGETKIVEINMSGEMIKGVEITEDMYKPLKGSTVLIAICKDCLYILIMASRINKIVFEKAKRGMKVYQG